MTVEVVAAGQRVGGFMRGTIALSMEAAASSFEVEYLADQGDPSARKLIVGDPVTVDVDGERVLDGYVDTTDEEDAPEEIRLRASGRSKAGDLIDCSASFEGFVNARVSEIARRIAQPFGINVRVEGDEGDPIAHYHVQPGDTAMDAITRAAQSRGLFPYSIGGELVLGRAGALETETKLVRGQMPLMRTARSDSWYARHSEYVFRGQVKSTDSAWGKAAAQLKHTVVDEAITRYRPLALHAEARTGIAELKARAEVERNQRAGRGERVSVQVFGHQMSEGTAWRPNVLVHLVNDIVGVDATLLVVAVRYRFGETEPREVELELARPEIFELRKYPPLHRGKRKREAAF